MSFIQLINQIDADKFEKEAREEFLDRKAALGKLSNWSKKLALSAIPFGAVAAFAEPARAQSNRTILEVLQYALTLEYLEATFYNMAQEQNVYPADAQATFDEITDNENDHVTFLQTVISDVLGAEPIDKPTFDYTLGGAIAPFENYGQFLLVSQAFEDTGVRAYKGQAVFLMENDLVLTRALQIHSVEARHASAVRRIRGRATGADLQGWIPFDQPDAPDIIAPVYSEGELGPETEPSEANITQAGANIAQIANISEKAASESFDEPLGTQDVLAIVDPFITSND